MAINIQSLFSDIIETPAQRQRRLLEEGLIQESSIQPSSGLIRTGLARDIARDMPRQREQIRRGIGGMLGLDVRTEGEKVQDILKNVDPNNPQSLIQAARRVGDLGLGTQAAQMRGMAAEATRQKEAQELAKRQAQLAIRSSELDIEQAEQLFPIELESAKFQRDIRAEQLRTAQKTNPENYGRYRVDGEVKLGGFIMGVPHVYNEETMQYEPSDVEFFPDDKVAVAKLTRTEDLDSLVRTYVEGASTENNQLTLKISETNRIYEKIKQGAISETPALRDVKAFMDRIFQGDTSGREVLAFLNQARLKESLELLPPGSVSDREGAAALAATFDLSNASIPEILSALEIEMARSVYEKQKNLSLINYAYNENPSGGQFETFRSAFDDEQNVQNILSRMTDESAGVLDVGEGGVQLTAQDEEDEINLLFGGGEPTPDPLEPPDPSDYISESQQERMQRSQEEFRETVSNVGSAVGSALTSAYQAATAPSARVMQRQEIDRAVREERQRLIDEGLAGSMRLNDYLRDFRNNLEQGMGL